MPIRISASPTFAASSTPWPSRSSAAQACIPGAPVAASFLVGPTTSLDHTVLDHAEDTPGWNPCRMTPDELERQAETLAFINSELVCRLDRQSDSLAKIDNKAVLVVGYALAAASFLATR